jgi:chaperonin GroES
MFGAQQFTGTLRPMQDWLILRPIKEAKTTLGGIELPDTARQYGRCPVVAAGPDCLLKKRQVVWIQNFVEGEFRFELNGQMVYAIRERHVNCIVHKGACLPIGDRILIKHIREKEEIRKGIWIPAGVHRERQGVEVVAVGHGKGTGRNRIAFKLKAGDRVLLNRYAGSEVRFGDEMFTIINENDIIGVWDDAKKAFDRKDRRAEKAA